MTSEEIDVPPDMGTYFAHKIPGWRMVDESTLTFYAGDDGSDIRTLINTLDEGYICWLDGGDVEGYPLHVFPVTVRSRGVTRGEAAGLIVVSFSVTSEPIETTAPAL
jgi:hypothetical protein